MRSHEKLKDKMLSNPDVRRAYEAPDLDIMILDEFLKARKQAKMTQEDVARKMRTCRPVVARLERSFERHSPSLRTLQRYAEAVGCRLEIRLKRESSVR